MAYFPPTVSWILTKLGRIVGNLIAKKKKQKKKHENQFSDDAIKTYFSVTFLYIDSVSINVKIGMLFIMFVAAGTKMRFTRILEASV